MRLGQFAALATLTVAAASAAAIGVSTSAQSIAAARIATLPRAQQSAWRQYLDRSTRQMQADRAFLAAELKTAGLSAPLIPPNSSAARSMPLNRPAEWYATADARRIADSIVSFQTPAGGWSKNLNLADHSRRPGETFAPNNLSAHLGPDDFDAPHDPQWNYVGTLDNDATTTEIHFLAKVAAAAPQDAAPHRASILRGIEYLLAAQFPNGGWPQVWPLEGGYHDAITFNDGAVTLTLDLLQSVAGAKDDLAFVPAALRKRAAAALAKGIQCVLATQILENGRRTVWAQQHDALTLQPVAGRNYEPAALCGSESAAILMFLMRLPNPDTKLVAAVTAAVDWFRKSETDGNRWARFYQIGTGRPIFGDRDKSIHDDVNDLSAERRRGYSWYNAAPQQALDRYVEWSKTSR